MGIKENLSIGAAGADPNSFALENIIGPFLKQLADILQYRFQQPYDKQEKGRTSRKACSPYRRS